MMHGIKQMITPACLRCVVSMTILLLTTWVVNTYLYPQFNAILPSAREASSVVGVVVLVVLALWVLKRPSSLSERTMTTACMVVFAISIALIVMGIYMQHPGILLIGSCLRNASTRWFVVLTGISLCTLDKKSCMVCIAAAFSLSYLLRIPLFEMGEVVSMMLLMAMPFVAYAACRPLALEMLKSVRAGASAEEVSITQPASYLPFAHKLFIAIFTFRIAYGFALAFGSVDGNPQQSFLAFIPLIFLFVMAFLPTMPKADVLYQAAALFVVAGFLAVLVVTERHEAWLSAAANGLLYAGSECFDALVWFALASIGARNRANSLVVMAWGKAAASAGLLLGTTIGHGANAVDDTFVISLSVSVVLLMFVAVNLAVLKEFSFQKTIEGVQSVQPIALVEAFPASLAERCEVVAKSSRLTPRETELLELLAHGRNGPFIQEKLVLSRNTVKTHVANIYAKLGVHSQQELIDMVEQIDGQPAA